MHFQRDEVYIGTAEERAAKNMEDHVENLQTGPGHMYKLPGFYEDAPDSLKELVSKDPAVQAYMRSIHEKSERMDDTDRDIESGEDVAADHVADDISASYSA